MKRLLICSAVFALALLGPDAPGQSAKVTELKKGLQPLNDFVGTWNGDGKTTSLKLKKESWQENFEWGWRFKGDDAYMTWKFKSGKYKTGELRYVPAKKNYELTLVNNKDEKQVFVGAI